MKREELLQRQAMILNNLSHLPRKMLALYGSEQMSQFVLLELCSERCFNFEKAAYLVDNPDFDCLKGVAGFTQAEVSNFSDIWQQPEACYQQIAALPFNQKVRSLSRASVKRGSQEEKEAALALSKELGLDDVRYCSWDMKHGNHGLLLFQKTDRKDELSDEHLLNGLSLLSFCPVS